VREGRDAEGARKEKKREGRERDWEIGRERRSRGEERREPGLKEIWVKKRREEERESLEEKTVGRGREKETGG
jgi:hypothetical protein